MSYFSPSYPPTLLRVILPVHPFSSLNQITISAAWSTFLLLFAKPVSSTFSTDSIPLSFIDQLRSCLFVIGYLNVTGVNTRATIGLKPPTTRNSEEHQRVWRRGRDLWSTLAIQRIPQRPWIDVYTSGNAHDYARLWSNSQNGQFCAIKINDGPSSQRWDRVPRK